MQKNLRVELSVDLAKNASSLTQVNKSAPVEIDAALFSVISGGRTSAPRGTWSVTDSSQNAPAAS